MLLLLLVLSRCSRVRLCATPETTAHERGLKLRGVDSEVKLLCPRSFIVFTFHKKFLF